MAPTSRSGVAADTHRAVARRGRAGWAVVAIVACASACGGRFDASERAPSGSDSGSTPPSNDSGGARARPGGSPSVGANSGSSVGSAGVGGSASVAGSGGLAGFNSAAGSAGAGGANGTSGVGGTPPSEAGGSPGEPDGGTPSQEPDSTVDQRFQPVGVAGDAGVAGEEQSPPFCGDQQCGEGEICRPGVGCEPACEVEGGLDARAAWPLGGGCPTRRGLSRYAGAKTPRELWHLDTGGYPNPYVSSITIGADHVVYTPYRDALPQREGFLQLGVGGHPLRGFQDWLQQCPIIADGDALYTVPGGLSCTSVDGHQRWQAEGPWNQSGEPAVGSDGTVYVGGISDNRPALVAVQSTGQVAWALPSEDNIGLNTWPAVSGDGTIYYGNAKLRAVSPEGELLWSAAEWTRFPLVDPEGNVYAGSSETFWSFTAEGTLRWSIPGAASPNFHFQQAAMGPDRTLYISYRTYVGADGSVPESGIFAYTPEGVLKWKFSRPAFGATTPVVDRDGRIYIGIGNIAYAVTPSGDELWRYEDAYFNPITGIAIDSDGTTLVAALGRLVALRDAPQ